MNDKRFFTDGPEPKKDKDEAETTEGSPERPKGVPSDQRERPVIKLPEIDSPSEPGKAETPSPPPSPPLPPPEPPKPPKPPKFETRTFEPEPQRPKMRYLIIVYVLALILCASFFANIYLTYNASNLKTRITSDGKLIESKKLTGRSY